MQETFIRAWRALPRFRAEASFSTWLYRICLNAVHDQRARTARGGGVPLESRASRPIHATRSLEAELSGELQRALAALDETYRIAVILYDVLGRSYAEIAEMLGVAEGTVKSRIFRGRTELARRLGTVGGGGRVEGMMAEEHPNDIELLELRRGRARRAPTRAARARAISRTASVRREIARLELARGVLQAAPLLELPARPQAQILESLPRRSRSATGCERASRAVGCLPCSRRRRSRLRS